MNFQNEHFFRGNILKNVYKNNLPLFVLKYIVIKFVKLFKRLDVSNKSKCNKS